MSECVCVRVVGHCGEVKFVIVCVHLCQTMAFGVIVLVINAGLSYVYSSNIKVEGGQAWC